MQALARALFQPARRDPPGPTPSRPERLARGVGLRTSFESRIRACAWRNASHCKHARAHRLLDIRWARERSRFRAHLVQHRCVRGHFAGVVGDPDVPDQLQVDGGAGVAGRLADGEGDAPWFDPGEPAVRRPASLARVASTASTPSPAARCPASEPGPGRRCSHDDDLRRPTRGRRRRGCREG